MIMGMIQSFTYAEIAGLFPNKSGGASVYGAAAWVRYSKFIAPLSVWCNWIAWTPVLSLGCSIAAAYILNALAPIPPADAPEVLAWVKANAASFTDGSERVKEWLAANAGKSGSDAVAALLSADGVAALTPAIRNFTLQHGSFLGPVSYSLNATFLDRRGLDADGVRDPASRHSRHRKCAEMDWPDGHHPDVDRRHRSDPDRADRLEQLLATGAIKSRLCRRRRCLGHSWLDIGSRWYVHSRLVDLRF